jgi:hypothetical protein
MAINQERAVTQAKLAGDRDELKRLELRADALVSDIRAKLDPYGDSVTELNTEAACMLIEDLHKVRERAVFLKRKIAEYEAALNG